MTFTVVHSLNSSTLEHCCPPKIALEYMMASQQADYALDASIQKPDALDSLVCWSILASSDVIPLCEEISETWTNE